MNTPPAMEGGALVDASEESVIEAGASDALAGEPDVGAEAFADGPVSTDATAPVEFVVSVSCEDSVENIYVTPGALPPLDSSRQGDVIRCRHDDDQDADGPTVDAQLAAKGIALGKPSSGVRVYRLSFRTYRADSTPAASTARVYLPTQPKTMPLPVVVVGHPTDGMGDGCATSKNPEHLREIALPWAARGYAVLAPDYIGFGNEGVEAYLNDRDQAHALLDGARALRKLVLEGSFTSKVVVAGYSQGGGAALSAHSLAGEYGAGGDLAAVVAFAPQWPVRNNSFALVDMLKNPDAFISYDPASTNLGYSNHVIWTQRAYGFFANFSKLTSDGGAAFPSDKANAFLNVMNTQCSLVAMGSGIYLQAGLGAKNSALFDPDFRLSLVACIDDPAASTCQGLGKEFHQYLVDNVLAGDPQAAPLLFVQGLADTVLPPNKEAACVIKKLAIDGVAPQICVDALAQHTDVTQRNIGFAIDWVEDIVAGYKPPDCPAAGILPPGNCDD